MHKFRIGRIIWGNGLAGEPARIETEVIEADTMLVGVPAINPDINKAPSGSDPLVFYTDNEIVSIRRVWDQVDRVA